MTSRPCNVRVPQKGQQVFSSKGDFIGYFCHLNQKGHAVVTYKTGHRIAFKAAGVFAIYFGESDELGQ